MHICGCFDDSVPQSTSDEDCMFCQLVFILFYCEDSVISYNVVVSFASG